MIKQPRPRSSSTEEEENPSLSSLLPDEVVVSILLRLPVRSLLRFKTVSKSWLSQISDPKFAKSHFDLAASPTHHRLFLNFNVDFQIESLDIQSPSLNHESAVTNLPFDLPVKPPCRFSRSGLEILGSCRGFVLFVTHLDYLRVCNPSTGAQRQINSLSPWECVSSLIGIGYDESTDDYLIVSIRLNYPPPSIEVFSLKTNSPVSRSMNDEYLDLGDDFRHGLFLNGSLHWLVKSKARNLFVVMAFDLAKRSVLEIGVSRDLALELTDDKKLYNVRVMKGCLGLCYSEFGGRTEIWILEEYKVPSSWTRIILSAHGIPRNTYFYPICFTKCGDVLGSNERGRLLRLNDKGELLEHCSLSRRESYVMYSYHLLHRHLYTESLLSLPS